METIFECLQCKNSEFFKSSQSSLAVDKENGHGVLRLIQNFSSRSRLKD